MDIRSPMLQPDGQWTRHSPLLSELNSFCAYGFSSNGFSSRAAALETNSDLDDLIAELDSSIVEYEERHCLTPLLQARSSCVTLQVDGADGLAELVCQPELRRSPELRPVPAPAGRRAPTVSTAGRAHDPCEPIGSLRVPSAFTVWSATTARSPRRRSSSSEATEATARNSPAAAPPRRTAAPTANRARSVSQEHERTRHVHDRGHSRDGRGRPRKKYRNKEAHARNLRIGSPNSSYAGRLHNVLLHSSRLIIGMPVAMTASVATVTAMTILIVRTRADEDTVAAVRAVSPTPLCPICIVTSGKRNQPWLATVSAVSMNLPANQPQSSAHV
jgi:hypothetical protein